MPVTGNTQANYLLELFNLNDEKLAAIRKFGKTIESKIPQYVNDFYLWLKDDPEYPTFFSDPQIVKHVKHQQQLYWQQFLRAEINEQYISSRRKVGHVHAEIGLPVQPYFSSMHYFLTRILETLRNNGGLSNDDAFTLTAVTDLVQLDTTLAIDAIFKRHAEAFNSMSQGEYVENLPRSVNDIFGNALHRMTSTFIELETAFEHISQGDLSTDITVKSENDRLAKSTNQMLVTLRGVAKIANDISEGDYDVEIVPRSDKDELAFALKSMTDNLRRLTKENEQQLLVANTIAQLSDQVRGNLSIIELADIALSYLCNITNALVGTLYSTNEKMKRLELLAVYATQPDKLRQSYQFHEGLIGQVAADGKIKCLNNVPSEYLKVSSSIGEIDTVNVLLLPLIQEGEVKGVIELGTYSDFEELNITLLEQCGERIAVACSAAKVRSQIDKFLQESQRQGEELRCSNEELEEHTQALRVSEEELQAQQEELEHYNDQLKNRTNDLQKQKEILEIAQAELENKTDQLVLSNKYKSQFLANMSHELRTPLNSMLILAKIFSENEGSNLTEDQVNSANVIYESGQDLLQLINSILDLSRLEAGKTPLDLTRFNIDSIIKNIKDQFLPVARSNKLDFIVRTSADFPEKLYSDKGKIQQVIKNLLSNAFKFTTHGSVQLIFRNLDKVTDAAMMEKYGEQTIVIEVKDSGIGIEKDRQALIFDAFMQADGSTSRQYGGTGLGLSISKEYAALLGGELKLKSDIGQGSTFFLYLPRKVKEVYTDKSLTSIPDWPDREVENIFIDRFSDKDKMEVVKEISFPLKKIRPKDKVLLLIEDDVNFAKLVTEMVEELDFKCVVCCDGRSAINIATLYKPTAILLDVMLPGMDGWSVLEHLKENIDTRHIPVQFISAFEDNNNSRSKGAVGFLQKPVGKEDIFNTLEKMEELTDGKVKKVLIVDNDIEISKKLNDFLEMKNVKVTCAEFSEEAYALIHEQHYGCVIVDLDSGIDQGVELVRRLTEEDHENFPPLIIYSTQDNFNKVKERVERVPSRYVIKDVHSQENLLDEVTLFLHAVVGNLSIAQQDIIKNIHDMDSVLRNKTVLVADDNMRNTFAIAKLLQSKEMIVVTAEHGAEALKTIQENQDIDIVLMDMMMPVMDGYDAIKNIRKMEMAKRLPIIALTAKALPEDRRECIDAGADDYLSKPVDTSRMLSMMRVWLQQ